jgi:hypothetical protein
MQRSRSHPLTFKERLEALILVATSGGPTMFARIGIMRALNRHGERVFDPSRKDKQSIAGRSPR